MAERPTATRNDLSLYDRHGAAWWDDSSTAFRSLRSVKDFRFRALVARYGPRLDGIGLVDLGCGGGLLAIPLAERGARVTGVDISRPSLSTAAAEAHRRGVRCRFVQCDLRNTGLPEASADLVLLSDVLEHVTPPQDALAECARLLKPGGHAFVNTINRTIRARILAVTLAEGLGYVPCGTHDPALFVRPAELRSMAADVGLRCTSMIGESVRILPTLRARAIVLRPSRGLGVSYSAHFVKEPR